jgi:hypothetical protein
MISSNKVFFRYGVRDDWGRFLEYKWALPLLELLACLFSFGQAFCRRGE